MRAKTAHNLAPRTDFGPAPKGYVPGAGRGAVGFTTRSDIVISFNTFYLEIMFHLRVQHDKLLLPPIDR